MKLETIQEYWSEDCKIDTTDLTKESIKIPQLHEKYYKIYIAEKIILRKYQAIHKTLKLQKYEFFINPTEEKVKEGWKVPDQGKLLKNETSMYLECDSDLVETELKIGIQLEKVDFLKSILDSIHSRGYLLKNILEDRRFMNGG